MSDLQKQLNDFDKSFDPTIFEHCVTRGIMLLHIRAEQMVEEGFTWNFLISRHSIEQYIINRHSNQTMMAAVIEYVEHAEACVESFNGIEVKK